MINFEYKSWIPNNNGFIDINKIPVYTLNNILEEPIIKDYDNKRFIFIKSKYTKQFSDSLVTTEQSFLRFIVTIFSNKTNNISNFRICLLLGKNGLIKAKGTFNHIGGIIEFKITDIKKINRVETKLDNIPNTIYTIIKNLIHGDNHHKQKIDTMVPVQQKKNFSYKKILSSLSENIKKNEFEAKRLLKAKETYQVEYNIYYHINKLTNNSKGILSYYNCFKSLFENEIKKENNDICTGKPESVIKSLEILLNEIKNELENKKAFLNTILVLLTIFISSNILFQLSTKTPFKDLLQNHFDIIELIIVFIISFFYFNYREIYKQKNITYLMEKYCKIPTEIIKNIWLNCKLGHQKKLQETYPILTKLICFLDRMNFYYIIVILFFPLGGSILGHLLFFLYWIFNVIK